MTENLLLKLEEKIMLLLTEIDDLRHKVERLSQENSLLKLDRDGFEKKMEAKLKDLISLFDALGIAESKVVDEYIAA